VGGKINKAGLAVGPFLLAAPWVATELPDERVSHVNNKLTPLDQDQLSYLFVELASPRPASAPFLSLGFRKVVNL
jgi:hypothetical protein